jgi:hypothetical protein
MSAGYVYVIGAEGLPVVKIGKAKNPEWRMQVLQTGTPVRLSLLWTTLGGLELEGRLHRRFSAYRKHGEWFDLSMLGDPVAVVREAVSSGCTERLLRPEIATRANHPCCDEWECDGRFGGRCIHTGRDMSGRRVHFGLPPLESMRKCEPPPADHPMWF